MESVISFLFGSPTHIWFWVALVFTIIEIETLNLFSAWFVFGAVAALITSLAIDNILIQMMVFLGVSFVLMFWLRSYAVKRFRNASGRKDNITELIELPCIVLSEIDDYGYGEVKLQGKIWRFRSDSNAVYKKGDQPEILRIEGNTIIVE